MDAIDRGNLEDLQKWLRRFESAEQYHKDFFEKGKENYNLYRSYKEAGEKVYKHDIFVPYSYAYMEDMTAYFMLSILASPKTYAIETRHEALSLAVCIELEEIVHWALTNEESEFVLEVEDLIKNVNIYNAAFLVNYPIVKERSVNIGKSLEFPGMQESITTNVFDRIHLDAPCPLDVFAEPHQKRLSRASWMIKRSFETYEKLKDLEGKGDYEYIDDVRNAAFAEGEDPIAKRLSDIGIGGTQVVYDKKSDRIELLDCMFNGDVITIGGRRAIIRDTTKDSFKPYMFKFPVLDCRTTGPPNEFWGIGIVESIKPTQKELNILRSQRRDNISLILNKMWMLDLLAGEVDLSTVFSAPGNIIVGTNIHDVLKEVQITDVTASAFKEAEELKFDMQNISSMWDYARGGTPRRRETATGIIRLQQAAQSRNEWQLRKLDAMILRPLAKRLVVYIREYLDRADYAAIVGKDNHSDEFYALDPDQLKNMLMVQPLTESIVSIKEVNLNQLLQAFDRLIQMPDINRGALIKALLQRLGQKNVKEILPALSGPGQDATMETLQSPEMGGGQGVGPTPQPQPA